MGSDDEQQASSLKVKIFGRRRTAEIKSVKEQPKFAPTEYQNPKSAVAFLVLAAAVVGTAGVFLPSFVADAKPNATEIRGVCWDNAYANPDVADANPHERAAAMANADAEVNAAVAAVPKANADATEDPAAAAVPKANADATMPMAVPAVPDYCGPLTLKEECEGEKAKDKCTFRAHLTMHELAAKLFTPTVAYTSCIGAAFALVWFLLLCFLTSVIFYSSIFAPAVALVCFGGLMIVTGGSSYFGAALIFGVVFLVLAAVMLGMAWYFWEKIKFTRILVGISCTVLRRHPALIFIGLLQFIVATVWTLCALVAIVGVFGKVDNAYVSIACFFPHLWGIAVISNVYFVICASTLARSYYGEKDATLTNMRNALTYSFGSICLAALLLAIIRTLKAMVEQALERSQEGNFVLLMMASCLRTVMDMLEYLAQIFNKYTLAVVAIYGMSFENSGYEAISLIYENGMQVIMQGEMLSTVSLMGSLFVIVVTGAVNWKIVFPNNGSVFSNLTAFDASYDDRQQDQFLLCQILIGCVMGAILWHILMCAVDSMMTTLLVCYCEDPEPMRNLSKELCETLEQRQQLLQEETDQEEKKGA